MGIAPYKYFTYDGESSRNYDVYLTGDGVFNAPERAVEMVEIPGRNGNYALDQGKFNNISVTYKAGIVDYSESNFADKVSAVRNWLCSKVGYKRLSDDYNPNEYRMAVFKSGVNIDHVDLKTGEFEITFDCKPQRWLTSGETAVTVADGGTLSNPTPFEAEPLLAVDGYGTIEFNGYEVEIENVPIGDIVIYEGGTSSSLVLDETNLNVGDAVTVNLNYIKTPIRATVTTSSTLHTEATATDTNSGFATSYDGRTKLTSSTYEFYLKTTATPFNITVGTDSTVTNTVSGTLTAKAQGVSDATVTFSFKQTFTYTASTHTITLTTSNKSASSTQTWLVPTVQDGTPTYSTIIGDSTKSVVSDTVYIDCDIGECYTYNSADELVSLNGVISLGSDLPKLSSGTNTFTYDNTVTELKVTPRWWKV